MRAYHVQRACATECEKCKSAETPTRPGSKTVCECRLIFGKVGKESTVNTVRGGGGWWFRSGRRHREPSTLGSPRKFDPRDLAAEKRISIRYLVRFLTRSDGKTSSARDAMRRKSGSPQDAREQERIKQ